MTRLHLFWITTALFAFASAHAEVIELEGTVKAVDAGARAISIEKKTSTGDKMLDLEVSKKAGDLNVLRVGQKVRISYDPDLDVVLAFRKRMPASHLLKLMRWVESHESTPLVDLKPGVAHDKGFVLGYLMGVGDALSDDLLMPVGQQPRKDFDDRLMRYLDAHPERADDAACDVIRDVLTETAD